MYVSKIRMINFMRYEDESVELSPRLNTIVGATDSGKSTIVRALRWVFYNRPPGTEIIRDGADEARVEIEINLGTEENPDLHTIVRIRSKKRNAYVVDGQEFDNVKLDVPDEAKTLTGVVTAEIGPKVFVELNMSRQMDGPFMLTGSGGDAAKIMGNLAGITTLDTGLASLKPDQSTVTKELGAIGKLEENYEASVKEFENLEDEAKLLETASVRIKSAQEIDQRLQGLRRVSERMAEYNGIVTTIDADIASVAQVLSLRGRTTDARASYDRLGKLGRVLTDMIGLTKRWEENELALKRSDTTIAKLQEQRQHVLHEAGTCPTCGATT